MSREALADRLQELEIHEQTLEEMILRVENILTSLEQMVWDHLQEHEAERR